MNNNEIIFPKAKSLSSVQAKPVEFYLKDFLPLPKGKVTILSGSGGTGKTFLLLQTAIKFIQEEADRKVLLWLSEDESGESRERAENIVARILGLEKSDTSTMVNNINIIGSEDMTHYINDASAEVALKYFAQYSMVVLDPLIGFYEGDENSNTQAKRFMAHLTRIASRNLQSIVLLHHHGKADADGNSRTRGASAFIDATRLLYELSYDKEKDTHTVAIAKDNVGAKKFFGDSFERKVLPYSVVVDENFIEVGFDKSLNTLQKMGGRVRLREQTFDITIEEEDTPSKEEILMKKKLKDGGYNFE